MKFIIEVSLILSAITGFAQAPKTEVLRIKNDTIFSALSIYTEGPRLVEKRYYRELESQSKIANDDLFMSGVKRFQSLDSIVLFAYDQHWKLKQRASFFGEEATKHALYKYSKEEFEVVAYPIQLICRSGSLSSFDIILKSLSAQDLDITIRPANTDSIFYPKIAVLTNRMTETISQEIRVRPGIHRYELSVETSNKQPKRTILETRGYDLLDADFTDSPEESEELIIQGGKDIFIQVLGNNKLLMLKNGAEEIPIPASKEHFTLAKDLISAGCYILELKNLKTGEKKACRVKII